MEKIGYAQPQTQQYVDVAEPLSIHTGEVGNLLVLALAIFFSFWAPYEGKGQRNIPKIEALQVSCETCEIDELLDI